jgi:dolichol-phosphate mannosyltransferase
MNSYSLDVSIIIPVKDEVDSIEPLAREVSEAMTAGARTWECIWVDDGSTDGSLEALGRVSSRDPRHRYISFEKNAGQSAAFWAGFREARGAVVATMDGDGQNDPRDLPPLIDLVFSGRADMVNGYRSKRRDGLVRKLSSRVANGVRNALSGKTVRDVGCSTRAFRSECVSGLPLFKGMHRFFPTLASLQGFSLSEMPVNHRPRTKGRSKYSVNNRLWVGLFDLLGVCWLRSRAFHYKIGKRSPSDRGDAK